MKFERDCALFRKGKNTYNLIFTDKTIWLLKQKDDVDLVRVDYLISLISLFHTSDVIVIISSSTQCGPIFDSPRVLMLLTTTITITTLV